MNDLLPIGRFARMSRLSIEALRLYDDLGLLEPAWVDPASGYRYYRAVQARRGEAIRILRAVDMPLERLIDRGGPIVPYDVTIERTTDQRVACLRVHTTLAGIGGAIAGGFSTVVRTLGASGTEPTGAPFIIYRDVIDEQTAGDIELCVPVAPDVEIDGGEVAVEVVTAGTVASTTHRGPYAEISPAYHALSGWIEEHGHRIAGPPREVYLNDPQTVLPDDLLTRIEFPIDAPA